MFMSQGHYVHYSLHVIAKSSTLHLPTARVHVWPGYRAWQTRQLVTLGEANLCFVQERCISWHPAVFLQCASRWVWLRTRDTGHRYMAAFLLTWCSHYVLLYFTKESTQSLLCYDRYRLSSCTMAITESSPCWHDTCFRRRALQHYSTDSRCESRYREEGGVALMSVIQWWHALPGSLWHKLSKDISISLFGEDCLQMFKLT